MRDLISAQYLDYRIAITKIKCPEGEGIPQEYRSLIKKQENNFNTLSRIEIVSGSSISDFSPYTKTNSGAAYFWSGKTNGIGGANKAYEIAKARGGKTLESILAENGVIMPDWADNKLIWDIASAKYAEQVTGEVKAVVGKNLRPDNIWENIELPRLKENIKVSKITIIDPETLEETIIFTR